MALTPVVHSKDGQVFANSRDVAAYFGKQHKDVLRAIDNAECSAEFRERNFALSPYTVVGQFKQYASYDMTKNGFSWVVLGFTGAHAAKFKEAYIEAFDAATSRQAQQAPIVEAFKPALPNFTNPAEAARAWALEYERADVAEQKLVEAAPMRRTNWLQVAT